jgi:hypothetical protein
VVNTVTAANSGISRDSQLEASGKHMRDATNERLADYIGDCHEPHPPHPPPNIAGWVRA